MEGGERGAVAKEGGPGEQEDGDEAEEQISLRMWEEPEFSGGPGGDAGEGEHLGRLRHGEHGE